MHNRTLLITGCAHSGTTYIATVLQTVGLDVGHAYVGADGTVSHWFAGDVVHPVIPRKVPTGRCIHVGERRDEFEFEKVWHQTRNPLDIVASSVAAGSPTVEMFRASGATMPRLSARTPVVLAMRYILAWSAKCEAIAEWRYRIEDIDDVWPEMLSRLGFPPEPLPSVSRTLNESGRPVSLTYEQLHRADPESADRMYALAARYGYE